MLQVSAFPQPSGTPMQAHALTRCDHSCSPQVAQDKVLMPELHDTQPVHLAELGKTSQEGGEDKWPCHSRARSTAQPHQPSGPLCHHPHKVTPAQKLHAIGPSHSGWHLQLWFLCLYHLRKETSQNNLNAQDIVPFIYQIGKIIEGSTQNRFVWKGTLPLMHFIGIWN